MTNSGHSSGGFTLAETAVASAVAAIILISIVIGGVTLQRTFAGSDSGIKASADQSRIMDYIARDLRQALYYSVCNSGQMLTLMVPDYTDPCTTNPNPRLPQVHPGTLNQATGLMQGWVDYNYANTCGNKVSYFPANAPTPPSTTYTYAANGQYLIRQLISKDCAGNTQTTQTVVSMDSSSLQITFTDQTTSLLVSMSFAPRFNFSNQTADRTGATAYNTTVFRSTPRTPTATCLTCP